MAMPPAPKPIHARDVANEGTDRRPAVSAAIGLSATMVIHGAPNDSVRITRTTVAMVQDAFVSTDCMLMGRCIMSYASWAPHGTVAVPGVMPRLTMREKMAPLYRRNAAAAAARKGTAKNNSVISVSSRSFYVRAANLPLSRPHDEARKLGTALCKKRPRRWTGMRITGGKPSHKSVAILRIRAG